MCSKVMVINILQGSDLILRVVEIRAQRGPHVVPVYRLLLFLPAKEWHERNQESNYMKHKYQKKWNTLRN